MTKAKKDYDAAMAEFRKVSAAHRAVCDDYRARKVGDAEFLASKAQWNIANAKVDLFEAILKGE